MSGGVSVYCCQNSFNSASDPITCADGQGPWRNPNTCNIPAFSPPPPAGLSPPPPTSLSPSPRPPYPSPPPVCPGHCSDKITFLSEGKNKSLYCCGDYFMVIEGCLMCTSAHGHAEGPFYDSSCSLPTPEAHCHSGSWVLVTTASLLFSVLISLLGAFYVL